MSRLTPKLLAIPALISLALLQSGCAGKQVTQAKQKIAQDLAQILSYQDCPTVCEALHVYLESQMGVSVPHSDPVVSEVITEPAEDSGNLYMTDGKTVVEVEDDEVESK